MCLETPRLSLKVHSLKGVFVMGSSCGCGVTLVLVFCLWGVLISLSSAARLSASRQKLEVAKHLNRLNKPPVKTIQVCLSRSLSFSLFTFDFMFVCVFWGVLHPPHFGVSSCFNLFDTQ